MTNTLTEMKDLKMFTNVMSIDVKDIKTDITSMKLDIQRMCGIISKLRENQDLTILTLLKCTYRRFTSCCCFTFDFPIKNKRAIRSMGKRY